MREILVTPRESQCVLGLINFFAPLVDLRKLHMRAIQHWIASRWDHSLSSIDPPLPVTSNSFGNDRGIVRYRVDTKYLC